MRVGALLLLGLTACFFEGAPSDGDGSDPLPDAADGGNDAGVTADARFEACGPDYNRGYRLVLESLDWAGARQRCLADGADLVIINDASENQAVNELRKAGEFGSIWIGATDDDNEGDWRWVDQSRVKDGFEAWEGGEPNDGGFFGSSEDCAELRDSEGDHWNDTACDDTRPAVCECSDS